MLKNNTLNFFVEKGDSLLIEGELSCQESVKDNASAPDVNRSSFVLAFSHDFGSCVIGTSTGGLEEASVLHEVGEAEVYYFDQAVMVDENVLRFEVSVSDKIGVGVGDTVDDLFEEETGIFLVDIVVLDVVVEFSPLCEFHDDEDVVGGVEHFVEFDDVVVVDELKDPNLPLDLSLDTCTLEIICLFFILRLFIIFTATLTPVRSCRASDSHHLYI